MHIYIKRRSGSPEIYTMGQTHDRTGAVTRIKLEKASEVIELIQCNDCDQALIEADTITLLD